MTKSPELYIKKYKLGEIEKIYESQGYQGSHIHNRRMYKTTAWVHTAQVQTHSTMLR